jgi:hypothetical protein
MHEADYAEFCKFALIEKTGQQQLVEISHQLLQLEWTLASVIVERLLYCCL